MKKFKLMLFFVYLVFLNIFAFTEKDPKGILFENISYKDGLSQNSIFSILQDKTGFIWFGTGGGLNRYDGNTFTVFQHDFSDQDSICDSNINTLYEDSKGVLWVGTENGLDCFDEVNNTFIHYKHEPDNETSLSSNSISSLLEDNQGRLLVGTSDSGICLLIKGKQFIRFVHNPLDNESISSNNIKCIGNDIAGNIWVGTSDAGLNSWQTGSSTFKHYINEPADQVSLSDNNVSCVYEAPSQPGILWVGTYGGGLNRFDIKKNEFKNYVYNESDPYSLNCSYNEVTAIIEDKDKNLWICTTSGGLDLFERKKSRFYHNVHDPENDNSLSINDITTVFQDRSGILWIGHELGGVDKYVPGKIKFDHYYNKNNNIKGLIGNSIWALFEDHKGVLWVGTTKGLDLIKYSSNAKTHYYSKRNIINSSLSNQIIYSICEDSSNRLWVGTIDGLNKISVNRNKITKYLNDPLNKNSLNNNLVYSLLVDSRSRIWAGTAGGLALYNPETDDFTRFIYDPDNEQSIRNNYILCLFEDRKQQLWIGTAGGGISIFDKKRENISHHKHDPKNSNSLSHNNIACFFEDISGNIWIGTADGLNKWNIKEKSFIRYGYQQGLINTSIGSVLHDSTHIWFTHLHGLSCLDPKTGKIKNYNITDGIQSKDFNRGAYLKSRKGEVFFGGNNGLNSFFPDKIEDNKYIPDVVLTSFKLFNKEMNTNTPVYQKKNYSLKYDQNYLSFEFVAISYMSPLENQYAYKMEGIDRDWIYCGAQRLASYNNIPPGDYIFRIKASNNDGIWNEEGTSISINISPPFWEVWWFQTIFIFLFILVLFFLYKIRTRTIRTRIENKHIKQEMKIKKDFVAMMVHDLGNPLNSIVGYSDKLKEEPSSENIKKTTEIITSSAEVMIRLIDDMLDVFKFEAGKIVLFKEKHYLKDIINNSISLMNIHMKEKKLNLKTDFETLPQIKVDMVRIIQLINNLLSNAIKFSPDGGQIVLTLKQIKNKEKTFQKFSINDDGPGIRAEQIKNLFNKYSQQLNNGVSFKKGTGLGLAVSKLIIEAHDGEIHYLSASSGGLFYFLLPEDTEEN